MPSSMAPHLLGCRRFSPRPRSAWAGGARAALWCGPTPPETRDMWQMCDIVWHMSPPSWCYQTIGQHNVALPCSCRGKSRKCLRGKLEAGRSCLWTPPGTGMKQTRCRTEIKNLLLKCFARSFNLGNLGICLKLFIIKCKANISLCRGLFRTPLKKFNDSQIKGRRIVSFLNQQYDIVSIPLVVCMRSRRIIEESLNLSTCGLAWLAMLSNTEHKSSQKENFTFLLLF